MSKESMSSIISNPATIFREYGLDPKPISQPIIYKYMSASLEIEQYHWGNIYYCQDIEQGKVCRWFVVKGHPPIPKGLPRWCTSIYVIWTQSKSKSAKTNDSAVLSGSPTLRAIERLQKRNKNKNAGRKVYLPPSHKIGFEFIKILANRLGKVLSRSQGGARDGDLFVRDHFSTSRYITILVRDNLEVKKLCQIWPLSRSETINIQVYTDNDNHISKMEELGFEVVQWQDGRKSYAIKSVDSHSIIYAAKYISQQLEDDDAL